MDTTSKTSVPRRREDVDTRFWRGVAVTGLDQCWEWTKFRDKDGYGTIKINGLPARAHRVAFELVRGKLTKDSLVLHDCDNPSCCNPLHLSSGSFLDNERDKKKRGRQALGERHGKSVMSESLVTELRGLRANGWSLGKLSIRYGIDKTTVAQIVNRKTWRHIK